MEWAGRNPETVAGLVVKAVMASEDVRKDVHLPLWVPLRMALADSVLDHLGNELAVSLKETAYYEARRYSVTILVGGMVYLKDHVGPLNWQGRAVHYVGLTMSVPITLILDLHTDGLAIQWWADSHSTTAGFILGWVIS